MRRTLALSLLAAAMLVTLQAHAADRTLAVAPFTAVDNAGPISVRIEVGKAQSVTASGSELFLEALQVEVVGDELRLKMRDKTSSRGLGDPKIVITVPQLTAFTMGGAGETAITHMSGDSLDIRFGGAGSLRAEGSVRTLKLNVGGVGSIDTRQLHAANVDVHVGGIGSVKVWASDRLDGTVGGIGSLTYYGDPAIVNTNSGGIGSISRGK
ncbi:MAG: DUF2807 domain-containing protein [Betaproteobacteria bacterium]